MKTNLTSQGTALTFDRLEAEIDAGRRAIVALSALELGIFDYVGVDAEQSVATIAEGLGLPERRIGPLLEALAAMGYLVRGHDPSLYRARPDAARFLSSSSDEYRGDELNRWLRTLQGWSWLSDVVRRDEQRYVGSLKSKGTLTDTTHVCLAARGRRSGVELLEGLEIPPPRRVLDLGGGTGGYARAILDTFATAEVTLFDRPEVIELAHRHLEDSGRLDRMHLVAGDFLDHVPEGPFDLVLLANVLHIFERSVASELVRRAARVVAPGGRLVVRDGMVDAGRCTPEAALLFGVHMVVFSNDGRIYSTDEVVEMIEAAGLEVEAVVRPDPEAEGAAVIGRRGP